MRLATSAVTASAVSTATSGVASRSRCGIRGSARVSTTIGVGSTVEVATPTRSTNIDRVP